MSWAVTTLVGLVAVMFAGTGIREPVTTISSKAGLDSSEAEAECAISNAQKLPRTTARNGRNHRDKRDFRVV
jgi:hypothetical protein